MDIDTQMTLRRPYQPSPTAEAKVPNAQGCFTTSTANSPIDVSVDKADLSPKQFNSRIFLQSESKPWQMGLYE